MLATAARLVLVVAVAAFAGVPAAATRRPVLITVDGVSGVRPGMTLDEVKQRLNVTFAGVGGGSVVDGAVCGSGLQGLARFDVGKGGERLRGIAFTSGVRTTRGISPGATFRALQRAYGRRLILDHTLDSHTGDADVVHGARHDLIFMVEDGRVDSVGLDIGGVLDVRCPTSSTPPPATFGVLSLTGASGLKPVMPLDDVLATWPWFPLITQAAGSGWDQWMPICAGSTRGLLEFGGGALGGVWFSSGASTDTGISIGATLADLRRVYGAALQRSDLPGDVYVVHAPGPPPVAAIGFLLKRGVVKEIGFGGAQGLGNGLWAPVRC